MNVVKRTIVAIAMVLAIPSTAAADQLTEPIVVPRMPSTRDYVMDGLTIMSDTFARQLNKLSFDLVKLHFDPRSKKGFLKFHGELSPELYLAIHSDVKVMGRVTRLKTHLFVGLLGQDMHLELPEIDLVPRSDLGRQYVELRLPIFYRRF